jgi:hypothetical protein
MTHFDIFEQIQVFFADGILTDFVDRRHAICGIHHRVCQNYVEKLSKQGQKRR